MPSKLCIFLRFWHHVEVQNRSQWSPKSFPKWSKIDRKRVFASRGRRTHIKLPIWSRFWTALGGNFGAKINVGSDLKSLRKEKPNLIRFRSRFWTHFERFLTPHRRSKGRSKQQGNDYCRSFKIIDFPKEKHDFYYFERCPIA